MKPIPKPIRRSKELVPLSKEHHEGLLFAWKIKQGLRNGTPLDILAGFIQWFWEAGLEEHFRREEQVLVVHLPAGHPFVLRMFEEHEQIEALVRLGATIRDKDIFIQLADTLDNHIRFEERELFPYAEEVLSPQTMEIISRELLHEKPQHRTWDNAFWVNEKNR